MSIEAKIQPRAALFEKPPIKESNPLGIESFYIAGNHGPCGGVNMALETTHETLLKVLDVNKKLSLAGKPQVEVHTTNPIVHYDPIMQEFQGLGLKLTPNVRDIPRESLVMWSAHGHSPEDDEIVKELNCQTIDTKCQLVMKPETIVRNAARRGDHVVLLGGIQSDGSVHPEPRGIMGHADASYNSNGFDNRLHFIQKAEDIDSIEVPQGRKIEFISQTTFSTRETEEAEKHAESKWGEQVIVRRGICHATDNRQAEVIDIARNGNIDLFIVVGTLSRSHNTKELARCAEENGIPVLGTPNESLLNESMFGPGSKINRIALTSGASVPDSYGTIRVINWFHERGVIPTYLEPLVDERTASFTKPQADISRVDAWLQKKLSS